MTAFVDLLMHAIGDSELLPWLSVTLSLCFSSSFKALVECLKVFREVETVLLRWVQLGDLLFALCRSKLRVFTFCHSCTFALIECGGHFYVEKCLCCWVHCFCKRFYVFIVELGALIKMCCFLVQDVLIMARFPHVRTFRVNDENPLVLGLELAYLGGWHCIVRAVPTFFGTDTKVMLLHTIVMIMHTFETLLLLLLRVRICVWIGHKCSI